MAHKYLTRHGLGVKEQERIPFKFKISTSHDLPPKNSFLKKCVRDFNIYKTCLHFGEHEIYIKIVLCEILILR